GSASVLAAAGAWSGIERVRSCAYQRMQVEDAAHAWTIQFDAAEFAMERLGTIVENAAVTAVLWQLLKSSPMLELRCPARVTGIQVDDAAATLTLDGGAPLTARLLVAADGANSGVRKLIGIGHEQWDYAQQAVVGVVRTAEPNPGTAWQRFMDGGPLAFLPLSDGQSSIVWTRPAREAKRLLALESTAFCRELGEACGEWLGEVQHCGERASFPLSMRVAERDIGPRAVLLGDAAHVVHPLAGQGVNLGLADAAALVEIVIGQRKRGADIGAWNLLQRYARWRRSENAVMAGGIHFLRGLHMVPALAGLRGFGLGLVSRSWMGREAFVRRAAGLAGNAPRLARGEGLESLVRQA
ncbi:MAG: UbiH/UbiF family hydroxylase, partial [Xanthomonadales bacterium]|nr:UbiH/UbiF family hydroxylase [Xanthomonadales bacterium]